MCRSSIGVLENRPYQAYAVRRQATRKHPESGGCSQPLGGPSAPGLWGRPCHLKRPMSRWLEWTGFADSLTHRLVLHPSPGVTPDAIANEITDLVHAYVRSRQA